MFAAAVARVRAAVAPVGEPDAVLVARYARGRDDAAFAELVRRHGPMVLAVCRRVTGDCHSADDAFQATFLVLARRAADVRPAAAVGNFLYGVAVRTAQDARSMAARRRSRETPVPVLPDVPAAEPADAEPGRLLDAEIARLPDHLRVAVVLCELEGRPRKDVAADLGVPEGTLSSRLAKARTLLAGRLRKRGVGLPATLISTAVVPPNLASAAASPAAIHLANGVVRTMFLAKLKLAAAGGLLAAAAVAAWPTAPLPAAPVPARTGDDLIWVRDAKTGDLTALTPGGHVKRAVETGEVHTFVGLDPANDRLFFAGQDGKRLDPAPAHPGERADGWTVHVRKIGNDLTGTDLGVPSAWLSGVHPATGTLLRTAITRNGTADQGFVFENAVIDLKAKKETKLAAPERCQLFDLSPDGKWALLLENNHPGTPAGEPAYRLFRVPVGGGKPRLLTGDLWTSFGRLSPDGTKLLATGEPFAADKPMTYTMSVFVIDVATAKATRIAGEPNQSLTIGIWSPDGKRVAYAWRTRKPGDAQGQDANGYPPTRLVVCDADGRNAKTISTTDGFATPIAWW